MNERESLITYDLPVGNPGSKALIILPDSINKEEVEKLIKYLKFVKKIKK